MKLLKGSENHLLFACASKSAFNLSFLIWIRINLLKRIDGDISNLLLCDWFNNDNHSWFIELGPQNQDFVPEMSVWLKYLHLKREFIFFLSLWIGPYSNFMFFASEVSFVFAEKMDFNSVWGDCQMSGIKMGGSGGLNVTLPHIFEVCVPGFVRTELLDFHRRKENNFCCNKHYKTGTGSVDSDKVTTCNWVTQ